MSSVVDEWATRIAQEVAPVEADLAPVWAEAMLQGEEGVGTPGGGGGQVGGFIPGGMEVVMPVVLQGVFGAAPVLMSVMASNTVGEFLGCVKNGMSLAEIRAKMSEGRRHPSKDAKAAGSPADGRAQLADVMDTLSNWLRHRGRMTTRESEDVTLRVLNLLMEDPRGASRFLERAAARSHSESARAKGASH